MRRVANWTRSGYLQLPHRLDSARGDPLVRQPTCPLHVSPWTCTRVGTHGAHTENRTRPTALRGQCIHQYDEGISAGDGSRTHATWVEARSATVTLLLHVSSGRSESNRPGSTWQANLAPCGARRSPSSTRPCTASSFDTPPVMVGPSAARRRDPRSR